MKKHQSNKSTTKPGLALLLLLALWGMGGFWECEGLLAAVTVTPISTDYAAKKVTFKVAWQNASVPYNNRVWVWIDYCPVTGNVPAASHATATVSNPEITGGYGTVTGATERGFFIEYANATNTGATVTATLSYASDKFNWCAYGSDYPPNAVDNGSGGYTLRGTKPFTINGSLIVDANTFGAGTCIASIADLTGRPDGFAPPSLTLGNLNSPSRCGAGAVTLSATASGATTPTMTYTWTVNGVDYTTIVNNYTTASLSASGAYTVQVENASGCKSDKASGNYTITPGGGNGQSATPCGCASGYAACSGICTPISSRLELGVCNPDHCWYRCYTRIDQCGVSTRECGKETYDTACKLSCMVKTSACDGSSVRRDGHGSCDDWCYDQGYKNYWTTPPPALSYYCYCCNKR